MLRGVTGQYASSMAGGEACQAFVPAALPPSPPLDTTGLQATLDRAHLALGRLDAIATLLPATGLFIYSYVRKEAVLSSQIEGTQSSLSDLMLFEMEGQPGVPVDDVQEVSCYVQALILGIERIREGHPIALRLLLELHGVLMTHGRGTHRAPGEFRRVQNWIGGASAKQAQFIPPPPNQVADCWAALEQFINDQPQPTSPLIKAALMHVQFETIHPFLDGNGRLGRMLIPLILVKEGVLKEPLLYLSLYFKTHRDAYYQHLQNVREKGDWEAWLMFFAHAVIQVSEQAVQTAQILEKLYQEDREKLVQLKRLSASASQVLEALFSTPIASVSRLQQKTGLTAATVGKVLDALDKELRMVKELTGNKRNRVFGYQAYIKVLNQGLSEL